MSKSVDVEDQPFSYGELGRFISLLKQTAPVVTFRDAEAREKCIILRHDADLNLQSVYRIALIERSLGVRSTVFVMTTADTYNPFSQKSRKILRFLAQDKFEIGLHFDPTIYNDASDEALKEYATNEATTLSGVCGESVRSISLHNPSITGKYPIFEGYINAYAPDFFSPDRYLSDSLRVYPRVDAWRGKNPYQFIMGAKEFPLQVVIHPEQWMPKGGGYLNSIGYHLRDAINSVLDNYQRILDTMPK
jgi:hypothetical protein